MKVKVKSLNCVPLFGRNGLRAYQARSSMGFSRQQHWSGLPWHILKSYKVFYGPPISFSVFHSIQFSHSVVSDSLPPHEPQHARPPCPSPTPGVHPNPNPCPLSRWCQPTISSSSPAINLSSSSLAIKNISLILRRNSGLWFSLQYSKHYEDKAYILLFFGQHKTW